MRGSTARTAERCEPPRSCSGSRAAPVLSAAPSRPGWAYDAADAVGTAGTAGTVDAGAVAAGTAVPIEASMAGLALRARVRKGHVSHIIQKVFLSISK